MTKKSIQSILEKDLGTIIYGGKYLERQMKQITKATASTCREESKLPNVGTLPLWESKI